MALNDATPFIHGIARFNEDHKFTATADTIKVALVTSSAGALTGNESHPCWGTGGSTNLKAYECPAGGNYSTGGQTVAVTSVTENGSDSEVRIANPTGWAQAAGNPPDARYAIFYNESAPNKECLGFYDFGASHDMTGGDTNITVGNPFLTVSK